ncbi:MAG: hypothetical protein ACHQ3P_01150 [Candidatus Limnocylindrales bacterium]
MARSQIVRATLAAAFLAGSVAVTALIAIAPGGGAAADPFVAGQQAVDVATLSGPAAAAGIARADATRTQLGLPLPARQIVSHVVDRFAGTTYDEVTAFDGVGRMTALQRFDPAGRLTAAVRFGLTGDGGPALADASAARQRAEMLASAALGTPPAGVIGIARTGSDGGWTVVWTRLVAGIPVPGDGVRVQLWPDGSLHGFSRTERSLAPAPAVTLDRSTARGLVDAQLGRWFSGTQRSEVTVTAMELGWMAPNDTFSPARPDAPSSTLRLCWVARVATTGSLADNLRGLELYLDAVDGTLIGGDVLR